MNETQKEAIIDCILAVNDVLCICGVEHDEHLEYVHEDGVDYIAAVKHEEVLNTYLLDAKFSMLKIVCDLLAPYCTEGYFLKDF